MALIVRDRAGKQQASLPEKKSNGRARHYEWRYQYFIALLIT
jgi:hypothetical protein